MVLRGHSPLCPSSIRLWRGGRGNKDSHTTAICVIHLVKVPMQTQIQCYPFTLACCSAYCKKVRHMGIILLIFHKVMASPL